MKSIITRYPYFYKGIYYPGDFIILAAFNPVPENLKIHDLSLAHPGIADTSPRLEK